MVLKQDKSKFKFPQLSMSLAQLSPSYFLYGLVTWKVKQTVKTMLACSGMDEDNKLCTVETFRQIPVQINLRLLSLQDKLRSGSACIHFQKLSSLYWLYAYCYRAVGVYKLCKLTCLEFSSIQYKLSIFS